MKLIGGIISNVDDPNVFFSYITQILCLAFLQPSSSKNRVKTGAGSLLFIQRHYYCLYVWEYFFFQPFGGIVFAQTTPTRYRKNYGAYFLSLITLSYRTYIKILEPNICWSETTIYMLRLKCLVWQTLLLLYEVKIIQFISIAEYKKHVFNILSMWLLCSDYLVWLDVYGRLFPV